VREVTAEEAWEVYTLRAPLETMASRLAAACLYDTEVARMEAVMQTMVEVAQRGDEEAQPRLGRGARAERRDSEGVAISGSASR